jgi:putative ABC transport system substrate-binding protein
MRRCDFFKVVAGPAFAWPLSAHAQQAEPMRRVGVLMGFPESDLQAQSYIAALQGGLQKLLRHPYRAAC